MWGDDFHKKLQIKKYLFRFFLDLINLCHFCTIDLKRQSEYSGLRPDNSSFASVFVLFSLLFTSSIEVKTKPLKIELTLRFC